MDQKPRIALSYTSTEEFSLFTIKLGFQIANGYKYSMESRNTSQR